MRPNYYSLMNQPQQPASAPTAPTRRPYPDEDCQPFFGSFDRTTEIPYLLWHDNFVGKIQLMSTVHSMDRTVMERTMTELCHHWAVFDYLVWARILGCGDSAPSPALLSHPTAQKHVHHTLLMCKAFGAFWAMYHAQKEGVALPELVKAVADVRAWQWQAGSGMVGPGKVARPGWQHNQATHRQQPRAARIGAFGPSQPYGKTSATPLLTPHAFSIGLCSRSLKFSAMTCYAGYSGRFRSMAALLLPPMQAAENLLLFQEPVTLGGALAQTLPKIAALDETTNVTHGAQAFVSSQPSGFLGQPPPGMQASFWPQNENSQQQTLTSSRGSNNTWGTNIPPRLTQQKAIAAGLQGFGSIPASVIASTGAVNSNSLAMVSQTQQAQQLTASNLALLQAQDNLPPPPGLAPRPTHQRTESMSKWQQEVQAFAVQKQQEAIRKQQEAARKLQESAARMRTEDQQAMMLRAEMHQQAVRKWQAEQEAERLAHERAATVAKHIVFLVEQCQSRFGDSVAATLQAINAYAFAASL
uniref:Uncharacterized protein n=1 Tax=Schizophyllum commune (strain H4-8 / FGSC 9210) TaxID=578458 RepID=D8PLF2_SCHCM